jgi:hypothetical protein
MTENEAATNDPAASESTSRDRTACTDPSGSSTDRRAHRDSSAGSGGRERGGAGVDLEPLVRADEAVFGTCPYCERPFATEDAYALHVGEAHADDCTAGEREAYADAVAAEDDELFYFHLRVVAGLAALYTVIVLAYMVALGSGFL